MKTLLETAGEIGPVISQYIGEDENNRRVSKPVLNTLREAGFLRLFLPKSLGGIEADPLTTAKVVEEVARYNTAAGWSLIMTYFGDQPFCVFGTKPNRYVATDAAARGSADGTDAVATARSLGLLPGSALYADVEHYDRTNASCVAAVRTYSYPGQVSVSTPVNTRSGPGTSYTNLNQPLQGGALAYVACQ